MKHLLLAFALVSLPFPALAGDFVPQAAMLAHDYNIGAAGFDHGDLDGNGIEELVFASGGDRFGPRNAVWSVQYYVPRRQDFEVLWQSLPYDPPITKLEVLHFEKLGNVIALGLASGEVQLWDGAALALTAQRVLTADRAILALRVEDFDHDGEEDLVVDDGTATWVLDPATLESRGQSAAGGSYGMAGAATVRVREDRSYTFSAELDGKPGLEEASVVGVDTTEVDYILIDGIDWQWRSVPTELPYTAIGAGDIDNDGVPEFVTASRATDGFDDDAVVTVYQGRTLEPLWKTSTRDFGDFGGTKIHDLLVQDVDGDDVPDIVVGAEGHTSAKVYVVDGRTKHTKASWEFKDANFIRAMAAGDIDGDGDIEVVAIGVRTPTYYSSTSYLFIVDAGTGALQFSASIGNGSYDDTAYDVGLANLDADPALEIVLLYHVISVFDGVTKQFWIAPGGEYSAFTVVPGATRDRQRIAAVDKAGQVRRISGQVRAPRLGRVCDGPANALKLIPGRRLLAACGSRLRTFRMDLGTTEWESAEINPLLGGDNNLASWRAGGKLRIGAGSERRVQVLKQVK